MVWCASAFDGNESSISGDAGGAVYLLVNIGDRR